MINNIINNINKNKNYIDETIYIIQYPKGKLSVSYGILDNIYEDKKFNFNHKCSTEGGSSGSPILNINNKLIGIHKEGYNNKKNKGTFLNYPIKEFIRIFSIKNKLSFASRVDIKNVSSYIDGADKKSEEEKNEDLEDLRNKMSLLYKENISLKEVVKDLKKK